MDARVVARIALIIWAVFVTVLSIVPNPSNDGNISELIGSGALAHSFAFFIITSLAYFAYRRQGASFVLLSGLVVFLYGAALEILQAFLPFRTFNTKDIAAIAAGILFFVLIWIVSSHMLKRKGAGAVFPK